MIIHNHGGLEVLGPRWRERIQHERGAVRTDARHTCGELDRASEPPNTVLFVAKKAYFNQIRMSTALRQRGWRTVAVVLDASMTAHNEGFFDDVVSTDLPTFIDWWSHSHGVLIHTQGWLFRYHIPVLLEACKPPSCRQVVEFMDLNRFMFPPDTLHEVAPYLRVVWGDDAVENHLTQIACESYIATNADGLVFPGDEGHQEALELDASRSRRAINFLSYPLREFFADAPAPAASRVPRLVFAGGIPTSGPRRIPQIFSDAQLLSVVEQLAKQGLCLDVFNNPLIAPVDAYSVHYPEHLELAARYPNYNFHPGALPWELTRRLAAYDYGLMLYDTDDVVVGSRHFAHLVPTKFFLYLEAGLPVLVSPQCKAVAHIVEHYGCGLVVEDDQRDDLRRILPAARDRLHRNAVAARETLAMNDQIDRLATLYDTVRHEPTLPEVAQEARP